MLSKKPYFDMSSKNDFEKSFVRLMNYVVFGKTMENGRKLKKSKFVTTERKRNYLVSEPNYQTKKVFTDISLAREINKKRYL